MGNFVDKTIACQDCGQDFEFPATQQQHFEKLGFKSDPKRCPDCRARRKQEQGDRPPRRDQGAPRELFQAVCAECGNKAMVPFRPTGGRPVYCSSCFQNKR